MKESFDFFNILTLDLIELLTSVFWFAEIILRFTQVITQFKFLLDIVWSTFLCRRSWFLELCSCLCLLVLSLELSKEWLLLSLLQQLVLLLAISSLSSSVDLYSSRFGPTSSYSSKIRSVWETKQIHLFFRYKFSRKSWRVFAGFVVLGCEKKRSIAELYAILETNTNIA